MSWLRGLMAAVVTTALLSGGPAHAATTTQAAATTRTTTVAGTLQRAVADNFDDHRAHQRPSVRTGSGTTAVPSSAVADIPTGARVQLSTTTRQDAASNQIARSVDVQQVSGSSVASLASPLSQHSLVVVPVYWDTDTAPAGEPTTQQFTAVASRVNDFYHQTTGGAAGFTLERVLPWTRVNLDPATGCDAAVDPVEAAVRRAVTAAMGEAGGDRHILAYFPQDPMCDWAGLAYVDGDFSWINGDVTTTIWAHELGHNLGLMHSGAAHCTGDDGTVVPVSNSCSFDEYGDRYDIMGANLMPSIVTAQRQVNLGLLKGAVTTRTSSGTVQLAPLSATTGVRAVRVPVGSRTYVIEYRTAAGLDTWLGQSEGISPEGWHSISPGTGVVVHIVDDADPNSTVSQHLVRFASLHPDRPSSWALQPGESWMAPDAGIGLSVAAASSTGATLDVTVGSDVTPPTTPELLSPLGGSVVRNPVTLTWAGTGFRDTASGIAGFDVLADENVVKAVSGAPVSNSVTVTLPTGTHSVQLRGRDRAGNTSVNTAVTLRVSSDTTAPQFSATVPTVSSSATVPIRWTTPMDDGEGLARFEVLVDGVRRHQDQGRAADPRGVDLAVSEGRHTVVLRATDLVGNARSLSLPLVVDTTRPVVTTGTPSLRPGVVTTAGAPVALSWQVAENGSGVVAQSVSRVGGIPAGARSAVVPLPFRTTGWTVSATDRAGWQGSTTGQVAVGVNTLSTAGSGWSLTRQASAIGGTEVTTRRLGARLNATVTGSQVGLVAGTSSSRGQVQVWIDGRLRGTVNLYSPTWQPRRQVWTTSLSAGRHAVRLVSVDRARPFVGVDALTTLP